MKKAIYSSILAIVLLSSLTATAIAATSSLVGKKVQSVVPVELNGKAIKDAVVIDGVTYAPVRSLSDASGYVLSVEGGKVKMTTKSGTIPPSEVTTTQQDPTVNAAVLARIQFLKNEINSTTDNIRIMESESIVMLESKIAIQLAYTVDVDAHKSLAASIQKNLDEERAQVSELRKKITAANAEIAQLESQFK